MEPYRSTPVFDEISLPAALRREHRTKPGVWGVIRVLEGELKLTYVDPPSEMRLSPGTPGLLLPDQPHFVAPVGTMKMQVDFYNEQPNLR
jgi:tellurite resistance-related uncharacterized protein